MRVGAWDVGGVGGGRGVVFVGLALSDGVGGARVVVVVVVVAVVAATEVGAWLVCFIGAGLEAGDVVGAGGRCVGFMSLIMGAW